MLGPPPVHKPAVTPKISQTETVVPSASCTASSVRMMEGFVRDSYRIVSRVRDTTGKTLVNEGRESACMIARGNNQFAFVIRTLTGYNIEVTMERDAWNDHVARVKAMLDRV